MHPSPHKGLGKDRKMMRHTYYQKPEKIKEIDKGGNFLSPW